MGHSGGIMGTSIDPVHGPTHHGPQWGDMEIMGMSLDPVHVHEPMEPSMHMDQWRMMSTSQDPVY